MRRVEVTVVVLMALLSVLAHAPLASAADTIVTPPLSVGGGRLFYCMILNTGSTQHITARIYNGLGNLITLNSPPTDIGIANGTTLSVFASGGGAGYCKVTSDGPPKTLLVTLCAGQVDGSAFDCSGATAGQSLGGGSSSGF